MHCSDKAAVQCNPYCVSRLRLAAKYLTGMARSRSKEQEGRSRSKEQESRSRSKDEEQDKRKLLGLESPRYHMIII